MVKRRFPALLVSLLLAGVLAMTIVPSPPGLGDAGSTPFPSSHDPVIVNGKDELASAADSGNGTLGNPFVIENKVIDAGSMGSAILIKNTNAYLVIRNCTVSGAAPVHAGIRLQTART